MVVALEGLHNFMVLLYQGVHVLGDLQEVSFEGGEMLSVRCTRVRRVGCSTIVVADTFESCVRHLVFCQGTTIGFHRRRGTVRTVDRMPKGISKVPAKKDEDKHKSLQ